MTSVVCCICCMVVAIHSSMRFSASISTRSCDSGMLTGGTSDVDVRRWCGCSSGARADGCWSSLVQV